MSLLTTIKTKDLGEGVVKKALPDMLIAGDPTFTSWNQSESKNGKVMTGVWEATPGTTKSIKGERFEFCQILQGSVELTEEGGGTVIYRAGDSFVMNPGFVGTWKTLETLRKIYVVVD